MNRTNVRFLLVLSLIVAMSGSAFAKIGTIDNVPGATLLLPYFEVSLDDPNAVNTVMNINNASATAVLAHVTLWTDLARPTFSFDVYLTGYDSATVDLRLIFEGILPSSASAGQDPEDDISPQGSASQDINFASCTGFLPQPRLTAAQRDHLRLAHTGQASPLWGGSCGAVPRGDNRARGYVTVDTVNSCSTQFPSDAGYAATITFQNVLFGEYMVIERSANLAYGDAMVPIEAVNAFFEPNPEVTVAGQYTFYGRYNGYTAADLREPLATQWHGRYTSSPSTEVIVWRDAGNAPTNSSAPFTCGAIPPPFSMGQTDLVAFDEAEEVADLTSTPFPYAANRVVVNSGILATPFTSGILSLNLNTGTAGGPPESPGSRQSFVTVIQRTPGAFGTAWSAAPLDNATSPSTLVLIP